MHGYAIFAGNLYVAGGSCSGLHAQHDPATRRVHEAGATAFPDCLLDISTQIAIVDVRNITVRAQRRGSDAPGRLYASLKGSQPIGRFLFLLRHLNFLSLQPDCGLLQPRLLERLLEAPRDLFCPFVAPGADS